MSGFFLSVSLKSTFYNEQNTSILPPSQIMKRFALFHGYAYKRVYDQMLVQ